MMDEELIESIVARKRDNSLSTGEEAIAFARDVIKNDGPNADRLSQLLRILQQKEDDVVRNVLWRFAID